MAMPSESKHRGIRQISNQTLNGSAPFSPEDIQLEKIT
jgi:hypothetical protein